ncbi:hypothetical protein T484DRAFT_1793464 [Baffinella frigidus]|nr:hypothetical protein T484DRAFT_1793464 [Cryptophyta sp. CCMP2293]
MVATRRAALSALLLAVAFFVRECGAGSAPRILSLRGGAPGNPAGRADGGNGKGAQIAGMEGRAARFAAKNAKNAATEAAADPVVEPPSPGAAAAASHSPSKGAPIVFADKLKCFKCK